ncbi:MAG: hypothetical protein AB7S92_16110 [Parvibaculaceae bacterium]
MQIRLPRQNLLGLGRRRPLPTVALICALLAVAHELIALQPDGISAAVLLFLPLVLFAALGAGRELSMPSLTELAFCSFTIVAVMAIWPSARLAAIAYEAAGIVTLVVFMGFVFALAVSLGAVVVKLLSGTDGET